MHSSTIRESTHLAVDYNMITDLIIPEWIKKLEPELKRKWESNTLTGITRIMVKIYEHTPANRVNDIINMFYLDGTQVDMYIGRYIYGQYNLYELEKLASLEDVISIREELLLYPMPLFHDF